MTPAGANVEHCHGRMGDLEELISGVSDHAFCAEDGQEEDKEQRDAAEDHVELVQPCSVDLWLGLVELSFNDGPADGVNNGLDEDDAAAPSVQEVEVLVGDAGDDGENALAGAEQDSQGRESIGERTHAVREAAQAGAGVVVRSALDRRDPGLVDDAHEREDEQVTKQCREHGDLQSRDPAEDVGQRRVCHQVPPLDTRHGVAKPIDQASHSRRRPSHAPPTQRDSDDGYPQQNTPHDEGVEHGDVVHPVHGVQVRACAFATRAWQDSARIAPLVLLGGICLVVVLDVARENAITDFGHRGGGAGGFDGRGRG